MISIRRFTVLVFLLYLVTYPIERCIAKKIDEEELSKTLYTDSKGYFAIIPPAGWRIQEYPDDPRGKVAFIGPKGVDLRILASVKDFSSFEDLYQIALENAADIKKRFGANVSIQKTNFLGREAIKRETVFKGQKVLGIEFVDDNIRHDLQYSAPQNLYNKYLSVAMKSMETYKPLKKEEEISPYESAVANNLRLAQLFYEQGDYILAMQNVKEGLEIEPENAKLKELKAKIETAIKDKTKEETKKIISVGKFKLEIVSCLVGKDYKGLVPYNPNKNPGYDGVLAVEVKVISGDAKKVGEFKEFPIYLIYEDGSRSKEEDQVTFLKEEEAMVTWLFDVPIKQRAFKLYFLDGTTLDLRPYLRIAEVQAQEAPIKEKKKTLLEALEDGEITEMTIEGSEEGLKINIEGNKGFECLLPEGKTKLGFIHKGTIVPKGWMSQKTFSEKLDIDIKHYINVGTNDFSGDGLYLLMDEPLLISIPKDKSDITVSGKGRIIIDIPFGFSGFELAGASGTIVTGKVTIEKSDETNESEASRFIISIPTTMRLLKLIEK